MHECAAWLTLLLLAEWVFGNLYEAVAFIPNAMSLIELKSRAGEAVFKTKQRSPIIYYAPASSLALVLMLVFGSTGYCNMKNALHRGCLESLFRRLRAHVLCCAPH